MGKSFFLREILRGKILFFPGNFEESFFSGKFCRVDPGGCTLNFFFFACGASFHFLLRKKGSLSDCSVV